MSPKQLWTPLPPFAKGLTPHLDLPNISNGPSILPVAQVKVLGVVLVSSSLSDITTAS